MHEMIDRVAKAIGDNIFGYVDRNETPNNWRGSVSFAISAIYAMREPTEDMLEAGETHVSDGRIIEEKYKRMIDAVLRDGS